MKKRKVIIDCDPGIDDSLAIMLALKSPEIEVIGITIVCGNSPVEMGFGNAKKILKTNNAKKFVDSFLGGQKLKYDAWETHPYVSHCPRHHKHTPMCRCRFSQS